MLVEQFENLYSGLQGVIWLMVAVSALFLMVPSMVMIMKGKVMRGIALMGHMLLGLIAMMGIIFIPIGVRIIFKAYEEALSDDMVVEN